MPLTDAMILEAGERYRREYDRYAKLAEFVYEKCQEIVFGKLTIRASVQRRAKHPDSLIEKLRNPERRQRYDSVGDVFSKISDLAGVRITTYVESDREKVVAEVRNAFRGATAAGAVLVDRKDSAHKHYRATHCQVFLAEEDIGPSNFNLKDTTCEIQVCSLLAHVFNEIEHDLQYKPLTGRLSDSERSHLDQLGLLTKAGDITIALLLQENERRLAEREGEFIDVHDFVARVRKMLPNTPEFSRNAGQLFDELSQVLELNTPEKVHSKLLAPHSEPEGKALALAEDFARWLKTNNGTEVIEPDTSDRLLMLLLDKYGPTIVEAHPVGRALGRPNRLVYFARRFEQMKAEVEAMKSGEAS
jgi:ppGpp synthetase/RelA/SpoT-type nucleotidyltranferase